MARTTNLGEPSRNREEAVIDAALELFALHGVEGTSMNQIAEKVGIRKPSLYHYFPNKEAIIEAIFNISKTNADWVREEMGRHEVPLEERLTLIGETFLSAMRKQPSWQAFAVRESMADDGKPWRTALRRLLRAHIRGRIDALASALRDEVDDIALEDAELIAANYFHSIAKFWQFEGHLAAKRPSGERCARYVRLLVRTVSLQLENCALVGGFTG